MKVIGLGAQSFLSFEEFEWPAIDPQATFVVGPNGAGKTNIFRALTCVRDALTEERSLWEQAGYRGARSFALRLDVLLEQPELDLLTTFLAAAMSDRAAVQEIYNSGPVVPEFSAALNRLTRLSAAVYAAVRSQSTNWLEHGTLRVQFEGNGRWTSEFLTAGASSIVFSLETPNFGSSVRLINSPATNRVSPFVAWWQALNEPMQWDWIRHLEGSRPNPGLPATWLQPETLIPMTVATPDGYMQAHDELSRRLGRVIESARPVTLRDVFGRMLRSAFRASENIRVAPKRYFRTGEAQGKEPDLTTGANLPLFLYHAKLAPTPSARVFDRVASIFHDLTGMTVDVETPDLPAAEEQQHIGDVALDIRVGGPDGVLLPFAGAGTTEALYIAAMMSQTGKIVLLDEAAANLHPTVQRRLARLVQQDDRCQYLVSTHSPNLLLPGNLESIVRVFKTGTRTRLTAPPREWLADRRTRSLVEKELRRSSDLRALLFERGVILVEGESELGALPIWYEQEVDRRLDEADVAVFSVNGDGNFATHIGFLKQFGVAWAVVCDGPAIGDAPAACRIADQLAECGEPIDPRALQSVPFAQRRLLLADHGVFTLAEAPADELEDSPTFRHASMMGQSVVGRRSKVRLAQYVAETTPWPDAGQLVARAVQHVAP